MYDDAEYASTRLNETIVRLLDGTPVYVESVNGKGQCRYSRDLANIETCLLDDLDVLSPPLGYVNHRGNALYLSRKPLRRDWRQGLRVQQLKVMVGNKRQLSTQLIMSCVLGASFIHPIDALKLIKTQKSVAINRNIALFKRKGKINIKYKWTTVAYLIDGRVVSIPGYGVFKSELEELLC